MNKLLNVFLLIIALGTGAQFIKDVNALYAANHWDSRQPAVLSADCDTDMECAQAHPESEF